MKCLKRLLKLADEIEGRLSKTEQKCADLSAKANTLEEDKAKSNSEIEELKKELVTIREAAMTNETKLNTAIEAKLIEKVDGKIVGLKPTFASVVSEQLDSRMSEVSGDLNNVKRVIDSTRKLAEEEKDREMRQNNIVLFRVPEVGDKDRPKLDKNYCLELVRDVLGINDIQDNSIKSTFRLGKKDDIRDGDSIKGRPIMVQFREKAVKNRVMESLIKLKDAPEKFKSIGISHDLTPSERDNCKKLVQEAKMKQQNETGEYLWRVRGPPGMMKVVRIRKQ